MSTARQRAVADGIATALLGGPWDAPAMTRRVRVTLGRSRSPVWLPALVAQVIDAYRDAPADRPRELAAYLRTVPAWAKAWGPRQDR